MSVHTTHSRLDQEQLLGRGNRLIGREDGVRPVLEPPNNREVLLDPGVS